MAINNGNWFAVSRMIFDHYVVGAGQPVKPKDPARGSYSRMEAWLWLIANAGWERKKIMNKGTEVWLNPGQLMAARAYLAVQWNWSEKTVRLFLKKLEMTIMISLFCEQKRGQPGANKCNILSICNYEDYQLSSHVEGPPMGPAKGQQRASQGPQSNNKQINKEVYSPKQKASDEAKPVRKRIAYPDDFEVFWKAYPDTKNNSKARALDEWKQIDKLDRELASSSLRAFHSYCRAHPDYTVLHAERYLKHRRFEGYADQASSEPFWLDPDKVALITDSQWEGSMRKHANGIWPPDKLGPAPDHPDCVAPKHIITKLNLNGVYDENGIKR